MKQKLELDAAQIEGAAYSHDDYIHALEGAKHYFCYLPVNGKDVLCIYDNGKWRVTSQQEIMNMMC